MKELKDVLIAKQDIFLKKVQEPVVNVILVIFLLLKVLQNASNAQMVLIQILVVQLLVLNVHLEQLQIHIKLNVLIVQKGIIPKTMQNVTNVQMGLILILKVQLLVFLVQLGHFQIKLGLHVYNVLQAIFLILKTQQNV